MMAAIRLNTPTLRFPSKILEEIFLCVIEGDEMERRKKSVQACHSSIAKPWPTPFALAAVCSNWRGLVRSMPWLWKYLVLDLREDKGEYYWTPSPVLQERIRQHLTYSHDLPLDITIITWGDRLEQQMSVILPLLKEGNLARRLDSGARGLERVELVAIGRSNREVKCNEVLEGLPPAQHLAVVCVLPGDIEIRVPARFCAQLRCIEAHNANLRLQGPCVSVTECALFTMDHVRIHTILNQTPNLQCLSVNGIAHAVPIGYSTVPAVTMAKVHTLACGTSNLSAIRFKLMSAIQLPTLRKLILIDVPTTVLSDDWNKFIDANGQNVDEVEVRATAACAILAPRPLEYLARICKLPALTSLCLVGDWAQHILGAIASQRKVLELGGVTHIHISDCTFPKRVLQVYGWSSLNPSVPWVWRRAHAKDIQVTLERVHLGSSFYSGAARVYERSSLTPPAPLPWRKAKDVRERRQGPLGLFG
jgi:hypothetical protein